MVFDKKKSLMLVIIFVLSLFFLTDEITVGQTGRDSVIINLTLTPSTAWWSDTITASGYAVWNNEDPFNETVKVKKDGIEVCNISASIATGFYTCIFKSPKEFGVYSYIAYALNLTDTITNSSVKNLNVKLNYGLTPIGQTERVVYEQPMLIQEPTGRIRIVWARVKIWRG